MYFPAACWYLWQACDAAWTRGDCGFRPFGILNANPLLPVAGSGKFVIPCERMHAANCSAKAVTRCCPAAVIRPPFGSRCRQAWSADAGAVKSARLAGS